jgi:hypothetical protein
MGLCLTGHHPFHSKGSYSNRLGLKALFMFGCPRSPGLAPWLCYVH